VPATAESRHGRTTPRTISPPSFGIASNEVAISQKDSSLTQWSDNDYVLLDDSRRCIGRIFLSPASPPDRNWMRTITARDYPRSTNSRGYSATGEEAMADFKARWVAA
jgi:hypothetical protein